MSTRSFSFFLRATLIVSMLFFTAPAVKPVSAATTFTVNSLSDTPDQTVGDGNCYDGGGNCTLRAAIMEANATSGAVTIGFTADYGIDIYTALPALNNPAGTTIKAGMRLVSINGANAGPAVDGLVLTSDNNRIQGLTIYNFSGNGIRISRDFNIIGMDNDGTNDSQEFNQIYSNIGNGIYVSGSNNRIAGNYIGQTVLNASKPNLANGIEVGGYNNLIGTNGDGVSDNIERNTIANNTQDGIFDHGASSIIAGNTIINNLLHGIRISLGGSNRVGTDGNGTSDSMEGNLISGNRKNGIHIFDSDSVIIAGNKIGVNIDGTASYFNYDYGIYLQESNFALIGTDGLGAGVANEGNLISGNTDGQVYILYSVVPTIRGNKIGTDITGTAAISTSQGFGIKLENSGYSGGTISGNLVSGTGWYGIQLKSSDSNSITGNTIGLDLSGQNPLPNDGNGIELINGSTQNDIISNTISGNDENGILFNGAINNRIRGNLIGTNANGTTALGNGSNGVLIQNSRLNIIGTNSDGTINDSWSNLILGNVISDIKIEGSGTETSQNGIYGNRIGTTSIGRNAMPIASIGVLLEGQYANNNNIQANLIANHNNYAVHLAGTQPTQGNSITRNSMVNNHGGISIQGAVSNDTKDTDVGANGLQNYPILTLAERDGNILGVSLNLNSTPTKLFFIHFYLTRSCSANQTDSNQGEAYIGSGSVTTSTEGIVTGGISFELPSDYVGKGHFLLATATSPEGSTSEFSNCIKVDGLYKDVFLPLIQR